MISKNIVKKKWDQKIFHQNAACYCIVKKCAFFYNYISVFQREMKKIIHKVSNFLILAQFLDLGSLKRKKLKSNRLLDLSIDYYAC